MPEIVNCPNCDRKLRVSEAMLGKRVKCPNCGETFTAEPGAAAPPPEAEEERPARRSGAGTRRPADEEDQIEERPRRGRDRDEDDEDAEERPGRRRPRDRDEEDEEDRPRRRRRRARPGAGVGVQAPAIALLVVGILGLLMGLLYVVQAIIGQTLVGPGGPADPHQQIIYWIVALVGLIWGAVVTLGGVKMMQLQSRGSVMVAAIFAMLPCNFCCLAGLPIGIWALVVLNNPEVKEAFD